jgi:tetratricopeptide (TPR) repeat protein
LRLAPEDAPLQEKLALLYYHKHDYPAAIEVFKHFLTLTPETPEVQQRLLEAYIQSGRLAMQEGKYLSALEHLAQALPLAEQAAPDKVAVIAGLQAEIYYQQGDLNQAFNAAQQASEKGATASKPYVILAFLHLRRGEQKAALKFLNQAAKKGLESDVGGHLLVNTGYGNLTIPVKDVVSVTPEGVILKSGEVFKGEVQLKVK